MHTHGRIRWLIVFLPLLLLLTLTAGALAAKESESNNTFEEATICTPSEGIEGTISVETDFDYYKFYADKGAEINISLKNIPKKNDYDLAVFDQSKLFIAISSNGNFNNEQISFTAPYTGYYYIQISSFRGSSSSPYLLTISAYSEGDDTPETAKIINIPVDNSNLVIYNMIESAEDIDWYAGVIDIPQKIRVHLNVPSMNDFDLFVYDKNLKEIGRGVLEEGMDENIEIYITPTTKGKIYFKIIDGEKATYYDQPYTLTIYTIPDKPIKAIREAYKYVTVTVPWQGRFPYDNPPGVAYSWGTKDTLEYFLKKLEENTVAGVNSAKWTDQFIYKGNKYNGNPESPNIVEVKKWGLGLKGDTIWSGGPRYNDPHLWAGIDCSGLVQRCQYAAGYKINNIGAGKFNTLGGEHPASWWATHCKKIGDSKTGIANIQVGDVVTYANKNGRITHVMLVSYVPYGVTPTKDNVKIIHAFSSPYLSGRKVQETLLNRVSNYTIWRMPD